LQISPRKKVILFVAIVFPLTWLIDLVNWLLGGTDNLITFTVLMVVSMFVPAIGAAIIMQFVTKEKLRDAGLKWGKRRYIIRAYVLMLAIALVTYGLTLAVGWGRIDSDASTVNEFLDTLGVAADIPASVLLGVVGFTALFTGVIVNTTYAFGEEFGWRGFLLPNLLYLGKLKACLISGVIWGVWHTPLILMGHLYDDYSILGILMMTVMCVFLGIIFGWLTIASGSLIPAIVAHAALNAQMLAYFPSFLVTDVNPVLGGGSGVIGLGVMGVVALWLVLTRRIR
jgi:membrane protease YdiL (CAAX protease family)